MCSSDLTAQAAPAGLSAQAGAGLYDEFMRVCVAAQGDRAKVAEAASAPGWKEISMDELPADARGELDQLQDVAAGGAAEAVPLLAVEAHVEGLLGLALVVRAVAEQGVAGFLRDPAAEQLAGDPADVGVREIGRAHV